MSLTPVLGFFFHSTHNPPSSACCCYTWAILSEYFVQLTSIFVFKTSRIVVLAVTTVCAVNLKVSLSLLFFDMFAHLEFGHLTQNILFVIRIFLKPKCIQCRKYF